MAVLWLCFDMKSLLSRSQSVGRNRLCKCQKLPFDSARCLFMHAQIYDRYAVVLLYLNALFVCLSSAFSLHKGPIPPVLCLLQTQSEMGPNSISNCFKFNILITHACLYFKFYSTYTVRTLFLLHVYSYSIIVLVFYQFL